MEDLVWAKMKGFSPWPGRICFPPPELGQKPKKAKGPVRCIFFFGTCNYAWIEENNIKNYLEFKDQLIKSSKTAAFKEAVQKIEEYISDPVKYRCNAEPATIQEEVNNDTAESVFDKLLEGEANDEENNRGETIAAAVAAAVAPKSAKKKNEKLEKLAKTREIQSNNSSKGDIDVLPPAKRSRHTLGERNYDGDHDLSFSSSPRRNDAVNQLLNRPQVLVQRPDPPEINMQTVSETLKSKNINPSPLRFGFLGLGIMGGGIVKNLLNSGHKVAVWNRTLEKCRKFEEAGAEVMPTPCDVVDNVDITFSCVSDPWVAKEMVFGNCGVLSSSSMIDGKGYVEMTSIDAETSQDIATSIIQKGGRYLEAQIQGSRNQAEEGTLIILAAGEQTLFEECQTCFEAMGKNSFYLGDVGNASKMNLILQMLAGVSVAAVAEALSLASKAGLQQKDVLEVLELTNISSNLMLEKGNVMVKGEFPTHQPLSHMQKDLRLALGMSESLDHPLPIIATINEIYKQAKRAGYSEHDSSAIYLKSKF